MTKYNGLAKAAKHLSDADQKAIIRAAIWRLREQGNSVLALKIERAFNDEYVPY